MFDPEFSFPSIYFIITNTTKPESSSTFPIWHLLTWHNFLLTVTPAYFLVPREASSISFRFLVLMEVFNPFDTHHNILGDNVCRVRLTNNGRKKEDEETCSEDDMRVSSFESKLFESMEMDLTAKFDIKLRGQGLSAAGGDFWILIWLIALAELRLVVAEELNRSSFVTSTSRWISRPLSSRRKDPKLADVFCVTEEKRDSLSSHLRMTIILSQIFSFYETNCI